MATQFESSKTTIFQVCVKRKTVKEKSEGGSFHFISFTWHVKYKFCMNEFY